MTELFRALATLAEPPTERTAPLAQLLGLDEPPAPAAYTDLFTFQQTPYASAYLSGDGMVGGEPRDRVAGFWRALGAWPPPDPDHLATMLGAYAALSEQGESEQDPRRRDAMTRARHVFLWEHLLSWLPMYLQAVRRHAEDPFATWARLLLDALLEEARELEAPAILPLHLRDVPGMPDPRQGDFGQFLTALLTPARSGMIVTRADLTRAARTLHGSFRAGDRKLALRSLLEQDAPVAFGWLADEARVWQDLHEDLAPATGPLADFWGRRAAATAVLLADLALDAGPG